MITITPATIAEAEAYYRATVQHMIARRGGKDLGMVALTEFDGRRWAFLDVAQGLSRSERMAAIRAVAQGMRLVGGPLYVTCNVAVHENAVRLMNLLGFEATGEARNGMEVYRWQS